MDEILVIAIYAARAKGQHGFQPWDKLPDYAKDHWRSVAATARAVIEAERVAFSHDQRAQAAVLADLPDSVAQEAGEFYECFLSVHRHSDVLKRECMAEAWKHVLRPYLIGLRDHHPPQARPVALTCPDCGVAIVDQPASGFIAKCGRRVLEPREGGCPKQFRKEEE